MEIIEVKKKALVLDSEEIKKLKECVNYLWHRADKHPESYVSNCELYDFIGYMKKKLADYGKTS